MSARDKAKLALLSAMYGGGTGEAAQLLAVLRSRFPAAFDYVEAAARAGEAGRLVRSRLGRTCPPPSAGLARADVGGRRRLRRAPRRGAQALRSRGRFTRNFVVQATAADWALALLASLRRRLVAPWATARGWCSSSTTRSSCTRPADRAGDVADAVRAAADEARRLLFGATPVRVPHGDRGRDRYADAK